MLKYSIEIYVQGQLIHSKYTDEQYDTIWLDAVYDELLNEYANNGYRDLYESNNTVILHNSETKTAVCITKKMYIETDFKDKNGNPIVTDQIYIGKPYNDENFSCDYNKYVFHKFLEHSPKNQDYYLRNLSRCGTILVEKIKGVRKWVEGVKDIYNTDLTQDYIDSLELYPESDDVYEIDDDF